MIRKIKHFKLLTPQGKELDSRKYQQDCNLLLVFYKGAWCNFCKRQIMDFTSNYKKFQDLNIKIIAISNDSQLNTSLLATLTKAPFPLLADIDSKVLDAYKIQRKKDTVLPTIYLVNQQGEVIYSYISSDDQDRLGADRLLKEINKLINN